jgi:hypothetical protein
VEAEKHFESLHLDARRLLKWILKGVGLEGMGWIELAQDKFQLATPCEDCNEPSVNINNGRYFH